MFPKYLKPTIYIAILLIPFCIVFFKPKPLNTNIILDAGLGPVGFVQSAVFEFKKVFFYRDTYEQYLNLKKQTDLLKSKIIQMRESHAEQSRLSQMSEFRQNQKFISVVADVIGRDPSSWNASLVVNKGNVDGIKIGMPVINSLGVVGKVIETGHRTSKVILVADPSFSVASVVSRTRESGLLTGTLQGICRLQYLTQNADVKVGDIVVTSKLSAAFPQGILIGQIIDVQAALNSHTVECLVQPAVDFSLLEEVVIIKNERN